jgi:thiamine kinase-like enzyme
VATSEPAAGETVEDAAVLDRISLLAGRERTVEELSGGLTNRNLRVRADLGTDVVVRISSNESSLLSIDRANERHNTTAAWQAGVGAPVVEALPDDNVLVVAFITGRTLEPADMRDHAMVPRIAAAVRTLHEGPPFQGLFDMRQIRRGYLDLVTERGFRLPDDYLALAPKVEALEDALGRRPEPLVPCNNDLLAANFIDDGSKIWLIDYEYSGMNEASFELGNIASESSLDDETLALLVECYWGTPSRHRLARAQTWSLLARYGWTLWASIQDSVSTIDFDFWSWGMEKYDSARAELLGPRYDALLDGLAADD